MATVERHHTWLCAAELTALAALAAATLTLLPWAEALRTTAALAVAYLPPRALYRRSGHCTAAGRAVLLLAAVGLSAIAVPMLYHATVASGATFRMPCLVGDASDYYNWALAHYDGSAVKPKVTFWGYSVLIIGLWRVLGVSIIWPVAANVMATLLSIVLTGHVAAAIAAIRRRRTATLAMAMIAVQAYFMSQGAQMLKEPWVYLAIMLIALSLVPRPDREQGTANSEQRGSLITHHSSLITMFALGCFVLAAVRAKYVNFVFIGLIMLAVAGRLRQWRCYGLLLAITLLWRGLERNSTLMVALAGVLAGLNILVRIPNVLGLSMSLLPIIMWLCDKRGRHGWKRMVTYCFVFLACAGLAVILTISLMPELHRTAFYSVMHDLRSIANDDSGTASHTTSQMIFTQLKFYGTQLWTAVKLGVPVLLYWWAHKQVGNKALMWGLKGIAVAAFVWFVYRMHPLQPVWLMCLVGGIMVMVENWRDRRGIAWMALLGIGMMLVMPMGSDGAYNNGTIVAWAIAPVAMLWWLHRSRIAFPLVLIAVCALRMVTGGAYFDGGPLWEKRYTVDNPRAAHIYTTRERAEVINTMLHGIEPHVKPGTELMAYGSIPLINYLTHTRPYIGCSWVEQLSASMLEKKLAKAPKTGFPLILQQKFSSLGPYWSEPMEDFRTSYGDQQNTYRDNRKLEVLNRFLEYGKYHVIYEDSHFVLYQPGW